MSQHVDRVTVDVDIDGGAGIAVQKFELDVAMNAIPTIILDVLPIDSHFRGSGEYVTATASKFSDLTSLYDDLFDKATKGNTKATIRIDVENGDTEGSSNLDSIILKNWVLTDASLTSVTSYSAPSLKVVFKHPIVALDRSGEVYEMPLASDYHKKIREVVRGATNMVDLMDKVYKHFSGNVYYELIDSKDDTGELKQTAEAVKIFRKKIGDPEYLPSTYLDCPYKLFLQDKISGLKGELLPYWKGVLGDLVAPFFGSGSTWMTIIGKVCPTCLMQVVPSYDKETLILEPSSPWRKVDYSIQETKVESVDMVSADPDPLCGVALYAKNLHYNYSTDIHTSHLPNERREDPVASKYSFYIPEKVRSDPNGRFGHIDLLGDNQAIEKLINQDYTYTKGEKLITVKSGVDRRVRLGAYHTYAKAMYECLYRRQCTATITTTVAFRANPGDIDPIYPGRVVTVHESSSNKNIFYGYLSRMVITGSASGGCLSTYELAYARPSNSEAILVEEGSLNPCY